MLRTHKSHCVLDLIWLDKCEEPLAQENFCVCSKWEASLQATVHQAKLLEELSSMYYGRYQPGQRISEATAVMNTMKEAIELTPQMTTKG